MTQVQPCNQYDPIRAEMRGLPFALAETLIANVVVGNLTYPRAMQLAQGLSRQARLQQENFLGAGI